jgi:hypothetical protein
MKKIVLVAIALMAVISCNQASAQARWGVLAGVNYNEIHFKQSDIFPVDRGVGFTGGVTGEFMMPGIGFGVEGSLLYTMRTSTLKLGDKVTWSSLGYGDEKCKLHYIDVPLSLKFKYRNMNGVENIIAPIAFVGPTFSFLVGNNLDNALSFRKLNVGLHMGIGCELFNKVQINGSYTFSIGEALRTELLDENVAKHRTWTVTTTYFF